MTKEEVIKVIQDNIADGENIFVSLWSFDVHPTWSTEFTRDDWNFAVSQMEGRWGEYVDEQVSAEMDLLMTKHREDVIQRDLQG